ncbi:transposase [Streptomyces sp. NPDC048521]|uniref:transposase n=1 Tax=Streptomyces sp. NPDC048521 TaxID=3365566 RepID=UPI00371C68F3
MPLCARGPGDHARPSRLIEDDPSRLEPGRKWHVTCGFGCRGPVGDAVGRPDLTDEAWAVVEALPPVAGSGRPARNLRLRVEGVRNRVRAGCPWRHLPERYGPWSSL